jgi:formiminoglutamase
VLTPQEIMEDGDAGAAEVYLGLEERVAAFQSTTVARAIVDVNRAETDRRQDGVVKTHTCWDVPVYDPFPPAEIVERLLARYYRPYHSRLTELARNGARAGLDCHTMAALGPPIGPGPGIERPSICLSDAGQTCPRAWTEALAHCLERSFECPVSVNDPFPGGFIIRAHAGELPWVQLEVSRAPFLANTEKHARVVRALREWSDWLPAP